jgi:Tc toxin complex TcA C-terminal TcB-binding domain/Neuraminidase-like domain/Salmonella virulence plasmid 28.1kDa A protein
MDTTERTPHYEVHGTVTGPRGQGIEDAEVIIWWQRIRERRRLGGGQTTQGGHYHIRYRPPEAPGKLLIIVEVISQHLGAPLESPLTEARARLQIDLAAEPHDKSEWATLVRAVRPHLGRLDLDDLVENQEFHDISFLAQETGQPKEQITRLTIAARLEEAYEIPAPAFFAFLRQQTPTSLPAPLLDATENFTLIEPLVRRIASLVFALSPELQTSTLESAVRRNLIGHGFAREIPEIVAALQARRASDMLASPYVVGKTSLGQLLNVSAIDEEKQQAFARALAQNTQPMTRFWRTLGDGKHGFTAEEAASIQRTLTVGAFVKNHVPLIETVLRRLDAADSSQLSDLARLPLRDWEEMVAEAGPPPSISPAGELSPAEVFARVVYARVTRAFPTAALASRVVSGNLVPRPEQEPLEQFFGQNGRLNLLRHNVAAYLDKQGEGAFGQIPREARPGVVANVKKLQRVLFVTPEVDDAQRLLGMGLHSAAQITMKGRQQFFVEATQAGISKRDANRVYNTSAQRYAGVVALYTQLNRDAIGVWPRAVGDTAASDGAISQAVAKDESLETLFGSQDYCTVDSCTSILSPAAYLCDLLYWLRQRMTGPKSALDVLNGRRPDIGNLKLNCPNTDTSLPYVDLVNEILSDAVSPPTDPNSTVNPVWKQTSEGKTDAELRAAPQYFNANAFNTLFGANYPHSMPYSEGLDELRAYLQQWGIALWQLRQALLPLSGPTTAQEVAVAAERFHMPPHTVESVTSADFVPAATAWHAASPATDLVPVDAFTHAASLTYIQLFELLQSAWVQGDLQIIVAGSNDLCDTSMEALAPSTTLASAATAADTSITVTSDKGFPTPNFYVSVGTETMRVTAVGGTNNTIWTVQRGQLGTAAGAATAGTPVTSLPPAPPNVQPTPLKPDFLDRAHRFLRLWRATGYEMWELDALTQSGAGAGGTLGPDGLAALGAFRLLQDTTRLAADAQLAWFQKMDTARHRGPNNTTTTPLYSRVYLNPAIASLHPDPDLAAVQAGGTIADNNLNHHLDAIQASLNISGADAGTLVTLFGLAAAGTLTLDNLSLLYRVTQLAAVAKLSIPDLLAVVQLIHPGMSKADAVEAPFAGVSAAAAALQQIKAIQTSGFSVDALTYLLTPPASSPPFWIATTAISDAAITTALGAVRQAILTTTGLPNAWQPNTAYAAGQQVFDGFNVETCATPGTTGSAVPTWNSSPGGTTVDGTATWTNDGVPPAVSGNVIAAVASQLGIANDTTAFVMQSLDLPGAATTLLASLTDPSLTSPPGGPYPALDRAHYPNQFLAVQLLDKVRVIVQKLHLVKSDLTWLMGNAAVYGGLDFTKLPVKDTQAALASGPLMTTVLLVKLVRLFDAAPPAAPVQTLYQVIGGAHDGTLANVSAVQAALSTITGWPQTDIASFATALGVAFPSGYQTPATYDALRTLEAMIAATSGKASASQLVSWAAVPADEATAESMAASALSALKSGYSNPDWLLAAPAVMNPLREHRSAALQDYLVGNGDHAGNAFADLDALFDHFLIDTQMSSCEVTTRVVQAYVAVQIFVERCRMNLEAPAVQIDQNDEAWGWWSWMKRYRVWEAAREVFLYPENWLIESQRLSRTEIYKKLEQGVHQGEHTNDYFETVALNYLDGLDDVAHLFITGTCQDPLTGAVHVIGRGHGDPPRFYHRVFADGEWSGWQQITLDIKAHSVVPAIYSNRLCLFWPEIKVHNEPHQSIPAAQSSSSPPNQAVGKYVSIEMHFSTYRNGSWAPAQSARGKLFDIPLLMPQMASDSRSLESLYTLKVQSPPPGPDYGASLFIDLFRLGSFSADFLLFFAAAIEGAENSGDPALLEGVETDITRVVNEQGAAQHIGRAVFDGRFSDLELRNADVLSNNTAVGLLDHAQQAYRPDSDNLLPLPTPDPDLTGEPGIIPKAGALVTRPPNSGGGNVQTLPLDFTAAPLEQDAGPLLRAARVPFRVVGPSGNLAFDPTSYFFYQDRRRCYYVETQRWYWTGSMWGPITPSDPGSAPFEARYRFRRFYHPYTRLMWHQLGSEGFPGLYNTKLQEMPDQIDPSHADVFSFQATYQPVAPRVTWGEDNEILDFSPDAAYSVYNWEVFFHIPLYIAGLLSQNQQFEDSLKWFHYIFDPTRQGTDAAPQRFWIPKPLHELTSTTALQQRINNLLLLVNRGDAAATGQVKRWRDDPFNPFLLADLRPVAYMKSAVMQYLDNLIAWADNLFATDSREALSEATLLYVIADEILGPRPSPVTPPEHADDSYNELAPKLDAFANAMVDIENIMGAGGGGMGGGGMALPMPQTFYFKIPSNEKLLGYWDTVSDRLFKLRHCQNIRGVTRSLALFDAPIDPGLLIKARAAGVDLGSVLTDVFISLPNYRYTALYTQALDFVNAVRAYGTALQSALEKSDADYLAVLTATNQRDLLSAADQIFDWQVQLAQNAIKALQNTRDIADEKYNHYNNLTKSENFANVAEWIGISAKATASVIKTIAAALHHTATVVYLLPEGTAGATGAGGTPHTRFTEGGKNAGDSSKAAGFGWTNVADLLDATGTVATTIGGWQHRSDDNKQKAEEAKADREKADIQLAGLGLSLQIAQQNQLNHQTQVEQLQKQLDFLTGKFTNQDLYDWMVGQLADTYFQSYRLAYRLCKQVEKCYQYELGIPDSDFIQFGYWDSLHKGLLAGETLNHDLRRMQSSYLDENVRRFEISRFVSLASLDPAALLTLLRTGTCDFDLPESLFDNDYPGHYNRRLVRVSVTVVYPSPGKFDNVKATLTLVSNKARVSAAATSSSDYTEVGTSDPRFVYNYGAVPQKIALGNAQDDPGLFQTALSNNLSDQRYLPFEGAGAVSSWRLEMPEATNEIDLSGVSDVVLHLYYTALYGGDALKGHVAQNNIDNLPASGVRVFSARNDFAAPSPTVANPYPQTPWDAFLTKPAAGDPDQSLVLTISPLKFPTWTRGKTITVTGIDVLTVGWTTGTFTLEPQAPLTQTPADVTMTPVAGSTEPNIYGASLMVPPNTAPGKWTFKLKTASVPDFRSLTKNDIGDVLLVVSFSVS